MKRVLVVDDEQPVVDHIVRIIERDLVGEFAVAGIASSGREAIEKAALLQPDVVVMDVRMPGLSGLDTVRELQKRGSGAAFLLSTAYERFDIARDALELGITGYLLKPVVADLLARSLRTAGAQVQRRSEMESKEFDLREKDREVRGFVAEAFLESLMLGQSTGDGVRALRDWLGIDKPYALIAAVGFRHQAQDRRDSLEATLQYKSQALCGPLVADRCVVFVPLARPEDAPEVEQGVMAAVRAEMADDLQRGAVRLGFADPRPVEDLAQSWPEALGRLAGRRTDASGPGRFATGGDFAQEQEFHEALAQGDADRVRFALDSLILPFEDQPGVSVADRYRIIALLGSAIGRLVGLGRLDEEVAHRSMDFDDLRQAGDGREFCLLVRARFAPLAEAIHRAKPWSVWISAAVHYLRENYGGPLTLDLVSEVVGVTPKRLSRLFIDELGQGFSDYLIDLRIEKAKSLLTVPGATIKQVSVDCGYPDPNYFARLFKKVTGLTPTEFSARQ